MSSDRLLLDAKQGFKVLSRLGQGKIAILVLQPSMSKHWKGNDHNFTECCKMKWPIFLQYDKPLYWLSDAKKFTFAKSKNRLTKFTFAKYSHCC